jgi:hypothetical protein
MQQVQSRIVPDGVYIDADGLVDIDLGNGGAYNPKEALNLFFQTGSVIGRSKTVEGEFNNGRVPIQELNHNSGANKMSALIGNYNHYLNMIRDVTGLNEARDASSPDPNSLVGLQKLAALNSNTATRHILDAGLYMVKRLSENLSLRIGDVLEFAEDKEEFANQIGKYNVAMLEEIKDLYMSSFGIFIEVSPDEEEKANLERNIDIALNRDQIGLEDAMDIREVKNLKTANALLKFRKKKKTKADQETRELEMQMQNAANIQSQEAAAQSKMQELQMESQSKIAVVQAETESKVQVMSFEVQSKRELMDLEFQYNMQLKGIETEGLKKREELKEDRKDKRVDKQSTQQSKMIQQRQIGSTPVDFESSEDTMDGIGLDSFGPK